MSNDVLTAALEFLSDYSVFFRINMIRRTSDLNARVADSGPGMVLPKNAMLHLFDNIDHSDSSTDTFEPSKYPFINSRNNLKYLHNFVDFAAVDKADLSKFSHRIYRPKLAENLKIYGMAHRKIMIPTPKLDTVIDNKNCIIIENYNPLYRIICTTHRPISQYERYRAFLSTALRNMANYNRQHILVIPVPDTFTYTRSNLLSIIQSGEISSQKLLSTSHFYFFIIDLVALLLDNNSKLSSLNVIDRRSLGNLNVMLCNKDKSIIVNIGKLATLAKSKTYIFSFIDNISRISGVDVPFTELPDAEADPGEAVDSSENDDKAAEAPKTGILLNNLSPDNSIITKAIPETVVDNHLHSNDTRISTQKPIEKKEKAEEHDQILPEAPVTKVSTIRHITEIPDINNDTSNLSAKQKERIEILKSKYKGIKVTTPTGTKSIEAILNEPIDISIKPTQLPIDNIEGIEHSMLATTTHAFDHHYQTKLLRKDILMNIVTFKDHGLFLTDYAEKNDYNSFTRVKHVKASFHDIKGKKHTINFKLPMPDDEGYYLINGVRKNMSKQLVNIPICKISPTRVSLISNYNKTLVEKVQSTRHSLPSYLATKANDLDIKLLPKHNIYIGIDVPHDYKQLGSTYSKIATSKYVFFFEYANRHEFFNTKGTSQVSDLEKKYGVVFGKSVENSNDMVFMNSRNICTVVNIVSHNVAESNLSIIDFFGNFRVPTEWCNLKILDKNLPIIFILAYRYGLSNVLTNLKVKYRFIPLRGKDGPLKNTEISIRFADGSLVFDRYPLGHSYILSGFAQFASINRYAFPDLDGKDAYYQLLSDKGMSTNYLKGIDNHFSFFIDPITKEILHEMGEPTNTRDLLLRAVDMLVDSVDKTPSAISNFRVRSAEKLPAMIYNEISRQYANYVNSNYKDSSFSINTEAIFLRIVQDETMTAREDLNPVHAIKETNRVTYSGFGGRSSEAFVSRDRKFPKDAIGILAETTTDSGSVGMVSALTGDPKIKNLRGMFHTDGKDLNSTNVLSETTLLMPGSTHDDPKRANFTSIQLTHQVPTPNLKPMRMRTGYEMVIPHKTSSVFIGKAKRDGKVTAIDHAMKLVTVTYNDKTIDMFEFGDIRGESPGMTVNHKIDLMPGIKVGSPVKNGSIITYHSEFFQHDPTTNQLAWCHGVPITVAIMAKDVTLEDSSMLSSELAEKLKFDSIYPRPITISTDMVVDSFADVGTKVAFNDPLIKLKYEETANIIGEVDELFDELKQVEYRSKHDGIIVGIQVYYVSESLNPSLTRFVNKVTYKARRKANLTKGTLKEEAFSHVTMVPDGTRIQGVQLCESDVLVIFHIKTKIACGIGDKIVIDSALKSVIGRIEDKPMVTEHGETIDMIFGANSIFNRIINSPQITGILSKVLETAEKDVLKMYFDE